MINSLYLCVLSPVEGCISGIYTIDVYKRQDLNIELVWRRLLNRGGLLKTTGLNEKEKACLMELRHAFAMWGMGFCGVVVRGLQCGMKNL